MNEIEYNGEKIPYIMQKSKIKNLYIHIKEGKVIVKAPNRLKEQYIKEFLNKKSKWIYENIKKYEQTPKKEENIEEKDIEKLKNTIQKSVEKYAKTLKVLPNKVRIKDIKYAWGSCSSNRNITINLKLVDKSEEEIKYVVLHELCHLKYMNHSDKFWSLVEKYMPNYKEIRKQLKH